ncbi:MAG: FecR domain-containing protein [Marinilabiliaceae bacterium]|jgi:ferric-dicitrate binding protein FerR (iron transport regulator)|nr:FecR domain-containing protein [Marinilabiliaceae bacterium]
MAKTYISWVVFRKAVYGKLSGTDLNEFEQWLNKEPENRKYFDNARQYHLETEISIIDDNKIAVNGWDEFLNRQKIRRRKTYLGILQKIAAFAVVAVFILFAGSQVRKYKEITLGYHEASVEPGRSVAMLSFDNGKSILLENTDTVFGLEEALYKVSVKAGRINYQSVESTFPVKPVLNRVTIPRGGEHRVTLPDGSLMYVNSETVVEYYVPFEDGQREISVSGEVCLEVKKDSLHPFRVKTDDYTVQVLGTTLNVSAYPDDDYTITTLVSGSLEITDAAENNSKRIVLDPDQQLVFDKTTEQTEIRTVDADTYTAWTRGFFIFEDETLYSIFNKLERWYDIKVFFFSEEAENEYFTGKLPRFDNLGEILEIINQVSLSELELKGTTVTIR